MDIGKPTNVGELIYSAKARRFYLFKMIFLTAMFDYLKRNEYLQPYVLCPCYR